MPRTKKQKGQSLSGKINIYKNLWKNRCYENGIPDEVQAKVMKSKRAPSYKAIALAILKNDHSLQTLGVTPIKSRWYDELKRIELKQRGVT